MSPRDHRHRSTASTPAVLYHGMSTTGLNSREQLIDERIRTLCLVILASAVVAAGMYELKSILVPFVLALALKYLLTPLIDVLSCKHARCPLKLPRGLAVLLALVLALGTLAYIGTIVAGSIATFTAHADQYGARLHELLKAGLDLERRLERAVGKQASGGSTSERLARLQGQFSKYLSDVSVTGVILSLLASAGHIAEKLLYIMLFLLFMLAGPNGHGADEPAGAAAGAAADGGAEERAEHHVAEPHDHVGAAAEAQIFTYIRGKVSIALLVTVVNSTILYLTGLELWLCFGVLTFLLNFIPNVGAPIAVMLPMPLIALDPSFPPLAVALAFLLPATFATFCKDVLEPLVLGQSTSLQPVAVLLSIMCWGAVWGMTGMVMAVPMTAVLRIYLEGVDHPLPRYFAQLLAGKPAAPKARPAAAGGPTRRATADAAPRTALV